MNGSIVLQPSLASSDELKPKFFHNLDLLRFVAALIVVIYHLTTFFPDYFISNGKYANSHSVVHSIAVVLFNGPAAVMLFFIVSGICIHAPYRGKRQLDVREFYIRRLLRIGIPLVVAWAFSSAVAAVCGSSALPVWSLWCEIAYYLLYPIINILIARYGFPATFSISVIGSMLLSMFHGASYAGPWSHGPLLTWIVFFPVWLTGVWICNNSYRFTLGLAPLTPAGITALGGMLVFGLPSVVMVLFKIGVLSSPLPMLYLFTVLAALFISLAVKVDISRITIMRFMDRQGRWSYSLYLIHFPLIYLGTWILVKGGFTDMSPVGLFASAVGIFILSIVLALVFYRFVEKPSHSLAKHLALRLRKRLPMVGAAAGSVVK